MKYIVLVRYMWKGNQAWKTIQREFDDMETAEEYAKGMYETVVEEITVLIYELKKAYN